MWVSAWKGVLYNERDQKGIIRWVWDRSIQSKDPYDSVDKTSMKHVCKDSYINENNTEQSFGIFSQRCSTCLCIERERDLYEKHVGRMFIINKEYNLISPMWCLW